MIYRLKKHLSLILVLCLTSLTISCGNNQDISNSNPNTTNTTSIEETSLETTTLQITTTILTTTEATQTETSVESEEFKYSSLIKDYPQDELSEELKSVEWSEDMVFTDSNLAKEYVFQRIDDCQENIGVIIPDGYTLPNYDDYKRYDMGIWSLSGTQSTISFGDKKAHFIVYHPKYATGKVVYNAYINNDTSTLSQEQLQVYNVAKDFIQNTLDKSKSVLEQEKQIFDYICNKTTYYNNETKTDTYERYKSSIGVLLDGSANCMGYSDAFFLLCSMAGMEVIYVSEENMTHAWNIITLDDKKYLVDVTYADTSYKIDGMQITSYIYFNAGLDFVSQKYALSNDNPTKNIVSVCDENYYFNAPEFGSYSVNGNDVYDKISSLVIDGQNPIEIMCTATLPTTDEHELVQRLSEKLPSNFQGRNVSCLIQPYNNLSYIMIYFK